MKSQTVKIVPLPHLRHQAVSNQCPQKSHKVSHWSNCCFSKHIYFKDELAKL